MPYILTHTVLVVRDDNESIKSFEDLNGKVTANTISSTYAATAEGYGATVTGVDALADTIQLVLQGRVDATLAEPPVAANVISTQGLNVDYVLREEATPVPTFWLYSQTDAYADSNTEAEEQSFLAW